MGAYTLLFDLAVPGINGDWHARQFPGACPMGPAAVLSSPEDFYPGETGTRLRLNSVPVWDSAAIPGRSAVATLIERLAACHSFQPGDLVGLDVQAEGADERGLRVGDQVSFALGDSLGLDFSIEA